MKIVGRYLPMVPSLQKPQTINLIEVKSPQRSEDLERKEGLKPPMKCWLSFSNYGYIAL
jgi:hypothetical protein